MRISDWSSDVCSSDLVVRPVDLVHLAGLRMADHHARAVDAPLDALLLAHQSFGVMLGAQVGIVQALGLVEHVLAEDARVQPGRGDRTGVVEATRLDRSEEHTSELQSLMRISYAVFC